MRPDQRTQDPLSHPVPSRAGSAELQATGVPSFIPALQSAYAVNAQPGSTPLTMFTFPQAGRIWALHLSYAMASNSSYSGTITSQAYALVKAGSTILTVIEIALGGPSTNDSGDSDMVINGLPVPAGTALILDINNGASISNVAQRASAVVLYSIP